MGVECYRCGEAPKLRAPFPYFGGKRQVAEIVWARLGDCKNYVEPFAGSLAVLLARPHWPFAETRVETVNDADDHICNFWRALQNDPAGLAEAADYPVVETDLHAWHLWLTDPVSRNEFHQKLMDDRNYYDLERAGRWVNGQCQWIGSGWCRHPEWQQLPHLGDAGMGVHRPSQQRPHLGSPGMGVHRPSQQRPYLGDPGRGELYDYLGLLAARLRRVRVCCGDWSRVCGPTPTTKQGLTAVFLDPPYTTGANRKDGLYARDDTDIGHIVRNWAVEHGADKQLRIALCGYEGEYTMPDDWDCVPWKAHGGYGLQGGTGCNGRANAAKERIWFSPGCIAANRLRQEVLF
jgi:DNA adenine methylase